MFDVGPACLGNEGDTIESADVDIEPSQAGDLCLDNVAADGQQLVLWLSGGQAGTTYNVTMNVGTAGGRTVERTITLAVAQLSAQLPVVGAPPVASPPAATPPATPATT